jgi:hypothetical protein
MNNTIDLEKLEGEITSNLLIGTENSAELKIKLRQVGANVMYLIMIIFIVLTLLTKDIITRELFASLSIILGLMIIRFMSGSVKVKY